MKKIIKWGIVGTAKIAETALIPAINKSKNSKLVAIGSRKKITALNYAKKHKISTLSFPQTIKSKFEMVFFKPVRRWK